MSWGTIIKITGHRSIATVVKNYDLKLEAKGEEILGLEGCHGISCEEYCENARGAPNYAPDHDHDHACGDACDDVEDIVCDDGFEDDFEHDKVLVTTITIFIFRVGRGCRRHR